MSVEVVKKITWIFGSKRKIKDDKDRTLKGNVKHATTKSDPVNSVNIQ